MNHASIESSAPAPMPTESFPHGTAVRIAWPKTLDRLKSVCMSLLGLILLSLFGFRTILTLRDAAAGGRPSMVGLFFQGLGAFIGLVLLCYSIWRLVHTISRRRQWRRWLDSTDDAGESVEDRLVNISTAIIGLRVAHEPIGWRDRLMYRRWSTPRLAQLQPEFEERSVPIPRYILDNRLYDRIASIPLTPEMIEPDGAASRGDGWSLVRNAVCGFIGFMWVGGFVAARFNFGLTALLVAFILYLAMITYQLAIYRGWTIPDNAGSVVGLGAMSVGVSAQWVVNESLTLIRPVEEGIEVMIANDEHTTWLNFASPADEGFIEFWRRWNHPRPRAELLPPIEDSDRTPRNVRQAGVRES